MMHKGILQGTITFFLQLVKQNSHNYELLIPHMVFIPDNIFYGIKIVY
jgi:hypothetical protein